ncbi:CPBP family intramembrane glutamic endopeptidase [Ectobacillus ponti]|uniref:CPBP family intramembrane metalloprotease n=1 Tax=Ectobacillus ponti TaxID=2961894 RepID=A0AA41XC95_9BACI|nr:CPBP family intramembrane glutamic endopeptidase [Ectobacillus ponti]MCP8970684.1 CPBP family intramembrane metalloprotease [Ectobacillus ponti]
MRAVVGFVVLDLYLNLVIKAAGLSTFVWVGCALLFFVLAHFVSRLTGLQGLPALGYRLHLRWSRRLGAGFLTGFIAWGILYAAEGLLGKFTFAGWMSPAHNAMLMLEAGVGLFLGSTITDAIVTGYVFAHLRGRIPDGLVLLAANLMYVLDDSWHEGFGLHNLIFSVLLGLSLGYAFLKTNSIWMTSGIHWGLNFMYALVYGIPGREAAGGLFIKEAGKNGFIFEVLPLVVPTIMFAAVCLLLKQSSRRRIEELSEPVV